MRYLFYLSSLLCASMLFSAEAQKPSTPKKNKAHFAGVRRPTEKPPGKKRHPKVKNPWVKTRTQPKVKKKTPSAKEEDPSPPSETIPHLD